MNFEAALQHLKTGEFRARRAIWQEGSFIVMMPELRLPPFNTQDTSRKVNDRTAKWIGEDSELNCRPYIARYFKSTNEWQPGWVPATGDLFAEDWEVLSAL